MRKILRLQSSRLDYMTIGTTLEQSGTKDVAVKQLYKKPLLYISLNNKTNQKGLLYHCFKGTVFLISGNTQV